MPCDRKGRRLRGRSSPQAAPSQGRKRPRRAAIGRGPTAYPMWNQNALRLQGDRAYWDTSKRLSPAGVSVHIAALREGKGLPCAHKSPERFRLGAFAIASPMKRQIALRSAGSVRAHAVAGSYMRLRWLSEDRQITDSLSPLQAAVPAFPHFLCLRFIRRDGRGRRFRAPCITRTTTLRRARASIWSQFS